MRTYYNKNDIVSYFFCYFITIFFKIKMTNINNIPIFSRSNMKNIDEVRFYE